MSRSKQFTLIELLTCIAIILILASLLLPVLRRARYRAKLVICVNNQRQIATAGLVYASDNNQYYVRQPSMDLSHSDYGTPYTLKYIGKGPYDERPALSQLANLGEMQCPMANPVENLMTAGGNVSSGYAFLYSWNLNNYNRVAGKEKGLRKVGDVMTFKGKEFDIVVGDTNFSYNGYLNKYFALSSHPDNYYGGGLMQLKGWSYYLPGSINRYPIDLVFTRTDGSTFVASRVTAQDSRLEKTPYKVFAGSYTSLNQAYCLLPSTDSEF